MGIPVVTRREAARRVGEAFRQRYGWTGSSIEITWSDAGKTVLVRDAESGRRAQYSYAGKRLARIWDNEAELPA